MHEVLYALMEARERARKEGYYIRIKKLSLEDMELIVRARLEREDRQIPFKITVNGALHWADMSEGDYWSLVKPLRYRPWRLTGFSSVHRWIDRLIGDGDVPRMDRKFKIAMIKNRSKIIATRNRAEVRICTGI
jgi:hypothetical protein